MLLISPHEADRLAHAAILGQLAEGVIVTDAAGKITFVNHAAAAIHGVARLDVDPDGYSATYHLFTEDGRPYDSRQLPLARAVRGETVSNARWRIRRPDQSEVLAIGSAQPLRDAEGRQIGAVLTLRDDTARDAAERSLRQSEGALRELNATLAQRVAERTREASAAQAEAEAGSRAKSEFLATMSHEIRTPLNGILGYTDLLLDETSIQSAHAHAQRILAAGSALLTIVNDILDFSKVEAGHIELGPEPFALADLADESLSIVRAVADRKRLALHIDTDPAIPARLVGDRSRLRQVLLNLLNNALKFTRAGDVTLRIRLLAADAGIARLRFAVEDTGIGIPANKRHLLFERFSQVDGTIQREFGGTGLGLAISRRLIDLMGGTIDVESEAGRGSTFWFEIGLPIDSRVGTAVPGPGDRPSTGRRLLLVEDVVLNQDLARTILEQAGHEVDVVSGGAEAIAAVQATRYDLVLMDIQMPGIDGITATKLIRCLDHAAADVPIVAMTANVLPYQIAAFLEAGMQDHVGKPFRREVLFGAIRRWARRDTPPPLPETLLDREAFDALQQALGREGIDRLLASLARELERRFGADGSLPGRNALLDDAHAMVGATSMLGFKELADLCREAMATSGAGPGRDPGHSRGYGDMVERLQSRKRAALATIASLRAT